MPTQPTTETENDDRQAEEEEAATAAETTQRTLEPASLENGNENAVTENVSPVDAADDVNVGAHLEIESSNNATGEQDASMEQSHDENNASLDASDDANVGAQLEVESGDNNAGGAPFLGFAEIEDPANAFENKDMTQILQIWESKHTESGFDPVPALQRLAEIFEKETEIYMRKDPDPFDERHPYRTDPSCQFGFLLKQLFRKDQFMSKLVNDYTRENYFTRHGVQKHSLQLNIIAARLILDIMPGLETAAVFQPEYDNLLHRIYGWATDSIEPLQSYATGLLAAAMDVNDIAVSFRESNARLVPKMIIRLHILQAFHKSGRELQASLNNTNESTATSTPQAWNICSASQSPQRLNESAEATANALQPHYNGTLDSFPSTSNMSALLETSRDAFTPGNGSRYYKKMYIPIHPPTTETSQMLIMRYLTSMGEYQEFLGFIFEHNVMSLIFGCISNLDRRDTCLAFEALKYLASLLCHKKFALEFIANGGLQLLLKVPRPSIAATGVSITLYYLAYSEDAMERICTMPKPIISQLVHYALWILGRSYDSGKCHATMFFGLSFQFKVILDEFDAQDGLRKLYNVISILKILNPTNNDDEEQTQQSEDVECASRQLVRHVCVALKRYMESHLFYKYNAFMRLQNPTSSEFSPNITKAAKVTLEQVSEQVRLLQENTSVRSNWTPVDQLLKLGGVTMLLKIITLSYDWNYGGRSETVRSALDVLSICSVIPKVFPTFCERFDLPEENSSTGIYSILGAAAGDITADAEVQKSALALICHCVCSPIARRDPHNQMKLFSASKKQKINNKYSEELIENIWEAVRSSNGIIVLLSLVQIKTPITDADCIRGMACRALAGLARSERVRQIISKLPLFASGQIQTLMRDPILQEKRAEHLVFQKYALELLECISGKAKPRNNQLDASLSNIHKANVVVQTKIQYNEQQLMQLIHDHLESKGLQKTAQMLQKEAGLQLPPSNAKSLHQSPFDYKVMPAPASIARRNIRSRMTEHNLQNDNTFNSPMESVNMNGSFNGDMDQPHNFATPIKLVKKSEKGNASSAGALNDASIIGTPTNTNASFHTQQRSLQKQISALPTDVLTSLEPAQSSPFTTPQTNITLGTIVTEYLTNQHALCNNPMTTCPQFDLFAPHKCPDPKPNRVPGSSNNLTARIFDAQAGFNTARLDRRYVHTHFAPYRTIRSSDYTDVQFTCCDIVHASNLLLVGTQHGEAKAFNINDGSEQFSAVCHNYLIDSILSNRAGNLVVTTCVFNPPTSILWSIRGNEFVSKLRMNDEFHCEFSNTTQDKLLGTRNDCAVIYDICTGESVSTFKPLIANQYTRNQATFNPTDELILSDGVLWDVRSGKEIHKFDKLNENLSGVFHPNGLEIISNTEVWDLRTFHLLQTVPVLSQCLLKFSPMRVIYARSLENEDRIDFDDTTDFKTSFKVLDMYDYSSISTIDVKRNIFDLSVNQNGGLIALLEAPMLTQQETWVKLYSVGMKKNEQQEEVCSSTTTTSAASTAAHNAASSLSIPPGMSSSSTSFEISSTREHNNHHQISIYNVPNTLAEELAAAVTTTPRFNHIVERSAAVGALGYRRFGQFNSSFLNATTTAASSNGGVGVVFRNRVAAPRPNAAGGGGVGGNNVGGNNSMRRHSGLTLNVPRQTLTSARYRPIPVIYSQNNRNNLRSNNSHVINRNTNRNRNRERNNAMPPPEVVVRINGGGNGGNGLGGVGGAGAAAMNNDDDEDQDSSHSEDGSDSDGSNSNNFRNVRFDFEDSSVESENFDDDDAGEEEEDDDDDNDDGDNNDSDNDVENNEDDSADDDGNNDVDMDDNQPQQQEQQRQRNGRRPRRPRPFDFSASNSPTSDELFIELNWRF